MVNTKPVKLGKNTRQSFAHIDEVAHLALDVQLRANLNGYVAAIGVVDQILERHDQRIDPAFSRKLFLLHALVLGEFPKPPNAVRENLLLLDEMRKRAERNRRPELFDTDRLTAFFDSVVPKEIVSVGELKKWLYAATPEERRRFRLKRSEWLTNTGSSSSAYPESIRLGNVKIVLTYRHTPDDPEKDGITASVRKADATALRLWRADWLVPGALPEKVSCLLGALPSSLRRVLSPISDTVAVLMPLLKPGDESLTTAIRRILWEHHPHPYPAESRLRHPPHASRPDIRPASAPASPVPSAGAENLR